MEGFKMKLVRKTIKYLLKALKEVDRIAVISFNEEAYVDLPYTPNKKENFAKIKSSVKNLDPDGEKYINKGMIEAFKFF